MCLLLELSLLQGLCLLLELSLLQGFFLLLESLLQDWLRDLARGPRAEAVASRSPRLPASRRRVTRIGITGLLSCCSKACCRTG